jgi:transglutaminase-like putative cysteine protease
MKGARGALVERGGNAHDLSTLLVEVLRAADVPAEYVWG